MKRFYIAIQGLLFLTSCKVTQYDYAFISNRDSNLDVYMSLDKTKLSNITNDKLTDYGLKWSPDGKFILYAKSVNKQYDLYLYDLEAKTTTQLTNDTLDQSGPSFTPDGTSICFTSKIDHKLGEVYMMNLSTKKITRITSNDRMDGSATFHPDGKRIFYASFMDLDSLKRITNSEIFVTDTSGTYHSRLTNRPGNDGALDISPDGKRIACHYFLNGKADIYTMDIDGKNITQLTSDTLDNRWPRWTPDGKHIAYTRVSNGNSDIWIMKANGKNKKEFVSSPKRDEILEFRSFKRKQ